MATINNLTSKIIQDAENKKEKVISEAQKESKKIFDKKVKEARETEKIIIEKAEIEAVSLKERIISNAYLKNRNEKLEAKQQVIKEIFEESIKSLANLPKEEFIQFVRKTILNNNIKGQLYIILNAEGRKTISESVLAEINQEIKDKANITLSNEIRKFKGGFILEKDGIEINYTFESLLDSLKDDLIQEVATKLFD